MKKSLTGNKVQIQSEEELARLKEENSKFIEEDIKAWERARFLVYHGYNPFPFNIGEVLRISKQQEERKHDLQRPIK
jgi:hypothetical protein